LIWIAAQQRVSLGELDRSVSASDSTVPRLYSGASARILSRSGAPAISPTKFSKPAGERMTKTSAIAVPEFENV